MYPVRFVIAYCLCVISLPATSPRAQAGDPDFVASYARLARNADAAEAVAIQGKDDWLFLTSEVRHLGRGPFWGEHAASENEDPLHSIADLSDKLRALGIELILCPAPPRAAVYADKLLDSIPRDAHGVPTRVDQNLQLFYQALQKKGVTVIDVTDVFLEARQQDAELGPVCCKQDTHWSPRGLRLAARTVAQHLNSAEWLGQVTRDSLTVQNAQPLTYTGDLVTRVPGHAETTTTTSVVRVTADQEGEMPLQSNADSPVLLLADSHGLIFSSGDDMHCMGAGFGEHLSAELGFAVDRMARRGSGDQVRIDLARRFLKDPAAVSKKKVIVYTFAARTFTESTSWKVVPLTR